ncbi:LytR/AlgR family response regulator transcription factor [Sinomicrobium weinanense]|uniref:Response regulator transcription factor n=1 Tax=Sinomicrobium weinanense TaxID=2842200 RepID=A0A926JQV7_9FLAO|nr:LytTR family DNA-binding domain-containing protein [Sinomicrobium weinanense]MBC9795627.1 response regulator transcription factor [Sinomicrobium weinanense]MBU3124648.1 LytTR family DNA-binding domain-containing protein [Sinomicrobium weinanense]
MRILVIEDETHTANRLCDLLTQYDDTIRIAAILESNEAAIHWFRTHKMPDLVFQDIELTDGNCFQIFDRVEVTAPIIFTTAYSNYALRSFALNSIDYIVKPYGPEDIARALRKLERLKGAFRPPEKEMLRAALSPNTIRNRLLIKLGDQYRSVNTGEIAYFKSESRLTTAYTFSGEKHIVDPSVNKLAQELDASVFFQVNRKFILNISAIGSIKQWFSNRLKLTLNVGERENIIVSRDRVKYFKAWLDQ